LRAIVTKSFLRHALMPGESVGAIVMREMK